MGSGARHGRGGARHHRRPHRSAHHVRAHNRNPRRVRVVHHHHANHSQWFLNAAARRRAQERATNAPSANMSANTSSETHTNDDEAFQRSSLPCLVMSRVLSIFLWFAGIMMMSLGGFQTPIGFVGVGCLIVGISVLILTSMIRYGCCSGFHRGSRNVESGEQQHRSFPSVVENSRTSRHIPREPAGYMPSTTADPAPSYTSAGQQTGDKPPSYEEVTDGIYPPTISATISPTTIENSAQPLPYYSPNEPTGRPYPLYPVTGHYGPPTHRGVHLNEATQLPYPAYSIDDHPLPPPYSTSERASVLPCTVSLVSAQSQTAQTYTTSPSQTQLGSNTSAGISPTVLHLSSQPPINENNSLEIPENFGNDAANIQYTQTFHGETQPSRFPSIENIDVDPSDSMQPHPGTPQFGDDISDIPTVPAALQSSLALVQVRPSDESPVSELNNGNDDLSSEVQCLRSESILGGIGSTNERDVDPRHSNEHLCTIDSTSSNDEDLLCPSVHSSSFGHPDASDSSIANDEDIQHPEGTVASKTSVVIVSAINSGEIPPTEGRSVSDQGVPRGTERHSEGNNDSTVGQTSVAKHSGQSTSDIDVTEDISEC